MQNNHFKINENISVQQHEINENKFIDGKFASGIFIMSFDQMHSPVLCDPAELCPSSAWHVCNENERDSQLVLEMHVYVPYSNSPSFILPSHSHSHSRLELHFTLDFVFRFVLAFGFMLFIFFFRFPLQEEAAKMGELQLQASY